jgi:hypothetical protein
MALEDAPGALENASRPEEVMREPSGLADVDDEPALRDGREARVELLETRFFGQGPVTIP